MKAHWLVSPNHCLASSRRRRGCQHETHDVKGTDGQAWQIVEARLIGYLTKRTEKRPATLPGAVEEICSVSLLHLQTTGRPVSKQNAVLFERDLGAKDVATNSSGGPATAAFSRPAPGPDIELQLVAHPRPLDLRAARAPKDRSLLRLVARRSRGIHDNMKTGRATVLVGDNRLNN